MNIVEEKWEEIIEHLKVEHDLSNVSFNTWIRPLKVYDIIDDTVIILVNSNSSVEYIEKKYLLPLKVCIADITGEEYEIRFLSEDDNVLEELKSNPSEGTVKKRTKSAAEKAGLNPKYPFDTFVVGGNNKCRITGRSIQSIVLIWRRGTWKNPSDAFHCPLYPGQESKEKSPLCNQRDIHQ